MKSATRNILILAGAVIIIGALVALYFFNKKHPDLSKVKPEYTLTANELYSAFEEDEATAGEKYLGKVIQVSGRVNSVESSDSTLTLSLMEEDQFAGVICSFSNENQAFPDINNGNLVTVRGECSGMLMDVLLNNCVLIKMQ